MTNETVNYHDRSELSSSQVATFLDDPIRWHYEYVSKKWARKPATSAMQLGTLVHEMIDGGGMATLNLVVKPRDIDMRTKAGKAWADEWAESVVVSAGTWDSLNLIWDHLQANTFCRTLIEIGQTEVEHIWDDDDLGACRMKADLISDGIVLDWKTTSKRSEREFTAEMVYRNYDVRLALYCRGIANLTGSRPRVFVVTIETDGGHAVTPYEIDSEWMDDAEARLLIAVDAMRNFNLAKHLENEPVRIYQPKWSQVNFNEMTF